MTRNYIFTCAQCGEKIDILTLGDYGEAVEDAEAEGWERCTGEWICPECQDNAKEQGE